MSRALLSGVMLALTFPKFNLWWLAWVALVPFFFALTDAKNLRQTILTCFIFGLTFFAIDLFWITSLFRFAGWWIVLGWVSFVLFQALFIILFGVAFKLISGRVKNWSWFLLPLAWTATEWLRAFGPFGFTGGDVGYTQAAFLPLIQIAALTSVYGISFLVVLVNTLLVQAIREPATKSRGSILFLIVVVGLGSYSYWNREFYSQVPVKNLKLALIQPNIDQIDKMNPAKVPQVFAVHEAMSRQAAKEKPDVIVWPETSIFTYLLHNQDYFGKVKALAAETGAWLLIGTPHYDEKGKVYNSIVSLSPPGEVVSRYDKEHLVPFGEYLPWRHWLFPLLRKIGYFDQDFNANPNVSPLLLKDRRLAAAVCFESTFPTLIKRRVQGGADFILTLTNDAWFGDSAAPYFHLQTGVFRAIENRKYFVQVGNTGFSALIDPAGRIIRQSKLNQREILLVEIPLP